MSLKVKINCTNKTSFYLNRDAVTDAFFSDIRKFPILTDEEEEELMLQYKKGKTEEEREKAKKQLIESNLRFVVSVAKKLGTPDTLLDLISEGNIGLIKAIEKFEIGKKCKLITYALSWIVAMIKKYQITQIKSVTPPNALKLHNYVKSVTREFFNENERNPTPHEIADIIREKFNFTINNLQDVELGNVISIEEKYSVMDDNSLENTTFFSKLTSTNNIQEDIEKQYQKHKLDFFLGKLSKRERTVVEKYYGIGCEQESFSTIGLQLNLGGERVRQICVEAVKKMKDYKSLIKD